MNSWDAYEEVSGKLKSCKPLSAADSGESSDYWTRAELSSSSAGTY